MSKDSSEQERLWEKAHREACLNSKDFYVDPQTGYQVFTEKYHRERGHCCESGCRHCPYGFCAGKSQK